MTADPAELVVLLPRVLFAAPFNALYAAGFVLVFVLVWCDGARATAGPRYGSTPGSGRHGSRRADNGRHLTSERMSAAARAAFLLAVAAAGVLGSRLLHLDLSIDGAGDRTVLGGLLGVVAAASLGARVLHDGRRLADALAVALPVGFAVGRVGCLLAGCCFGAPSQLPWAVAYGPGSEAFAEQLRAGLLLPDAAHAHGVHPVQLYEAIVALLIAAAARHARERGMTRLLLPVAAAYLVARLPLQLLRGSAVPDTMLLLLAALTALLLLFHLRSAGAPVVATPRAAAAGALAAAAVAAAATIATPLELAVLATLAIPTTIVGLVGVIGLPGFAGFARFTRPAGFARFTRPAAVAGFARTAARPRPGYTAALPVLGLMLLQLPADSAAFPQRYVTVGGSATTGRYVESCGGAHRYSVGGVSAAYVSLPRPDERYSVRAQVFGGTDRDEESGAPGQSESSVGGVAIVGSAHYRWVGGSLGVLAGSLYLDGSPESILPVAALTLGPPSLYVEGRIFDAEPAGVPAPAVQVGIAARVDRAGSLLRVGVSDAGFYATGTLVSGNWEVEPRGAIGDESTWQLGLVLRRRFALLP